MALHCVRTVIGCPPTENDREDLRVLQTLGAPVFIVTGDEKLIRRVDESRTHQAPWVRKPDEMFDGRLPTSVPWGTHAHRFASTFERRRDTTSAKK